MRGVARMAAAARDLGSQELRGERGAERQAQGAERSPGLCLQGWKQVDSELVGAFFGWNLTSPSVGVTICVGDSLSVTLWRDRATLKPVNA